MADDTIVPFGPQYDVDDEESDASSIPSAVSVSSSNEDLSNPNSASEYDDDEENTAEIDAGSQHKWKLFVPSLNVNCFPMNDSANTMVIGLKKGQDIMICGSYRIQIMKGGIKYNEVHYNASWKELSIWHPTCSSMSPISSSFYASWDERTFISPEASTSGLIHENFECILKVSSRCSGLLEIKNLCPIFNDLWLPWGHIPTETYSSRSSYAILCQGTMRDTARISTMTISKTWSDKLAELALFHKNNPHDMRVIVLGGKNSGKSTFLRLLLQKFLHSDATDSDSICYLDVDPGQTEFSRPDCISMSKLSNDVELGNPLGQSRVERIIEYYVGTSSPHSFPTKYLSEVNHLIDTFSNENHMGTTLLNVPGWIKGFGIQIMNNIISHFKPTHIVFIEADSRNSGLMNELEIDSTFSTLQRDEYEPTVLRIDGYHGSSHPTLHNKLHASHLRLFRLLAYFHKLKDVSRSIAYDFRPLVHTAPLKVSFGTHGPIKAFDVTDLKEVSVSNLKDALEGTIVGLFKCREGLELTIIDNVPLLKGLEDCEFVTLGFIHSINLQEAHVNIYIPFLDVNRVREQCDLGWMIRRAKTETPICELYPINGDLSAFKHSGLPFLSFSKQKRHEFVWKVRRNILRRGHQTK